MYPTFDKIREMAAAGDYKRIPICKELYADSYTPVEMMRISAKGKSPLLSAGKCQSERGVGQIFFSWI